MTRPILALALGLCAALIAAPARVAEPDPAAAVGRLNTAGYNRLEMCSAALVAPALVLTAAHCVLDADGYAKRVEDMVFVAGWDGAGHSGASRVASVTAHPRAFAGGRIRIEHDLALVHLQDALDLPPVPVGVSPPDGPFRLLGYPRSTPHRLRDSAGCTGRQSAGLWRIGCAIERGQSGGPVLFGDGAGLRIVAVLSARSGEEALAVPLDAWLRRTLAEAR